VQSEALSLYHKLLKATQDLNDTATSATEPNAQAANRKVMGRRVVSAADVFALSPAKSPASEATRRAADSATKNTPWRPNAMQRHVRAVFDERRAIPRQEVAKIEWCLHQGRSQLEDLTNRGRHQTGFTVFNVPEE
jgi:hypothetical protein